MLKKFIWLFVTALTISLPAVSQQKDIPPAPLYPVPSDQQIAWHEMEMNAFIHFTINTFTDKEWGMGDESPALFNPTQNDPKQWMNVLKNCGFKGVILTCKHHDGFCLWPSRYTAHSIQFSPYKEGKGDIVREVSDACKLYGLKFGVYLSPWDRNQATYGKPEYLDYYRNQLQELFTGYGPVFEMWFDGANGGTGYYDGANEKRTIDGKTYYDWPTTLSIIRKIEPGVIFFSDAGPGVRWVGNENGIAGETNWAIINPDTLYAGKPGIEKLLNTGSSDGTCWIPAEVDVSIRPGWFYHQNEDTLVKSPAELFNIYRTSVGRGSVLLLNVPPDQRGQFHENDIQSLLGFKKMLEQEFNHNLASKAIAHAGSFRGNLQEYSPAGMIDGDKDTYWATDDTITSEYFQIDLDEAKIIGYIVLQEYIRLGQRVKGFTVEVLTDKGWERVADGSTIGYKRILKVNPVKARSIRINITDSRACPLISNAEVY